MRGRVGLPNSLVSKPLGYLRMSFEKLLLTLGNATFSQARRYMPIIPTLRRLRQEDCCELIVSLHYTE